MSATAVQTKQQQQRPWWLTLVMGIAAVIVGGILLFGSLTAQARTYLLLVQLLGIWWLVDGIVNIIYLFTDRTAWGWKLFSGIVGLLAGGWILIYPVYAAVALPRIFVLIIGIWGLFHGMEMLFMGFRARAWGAVILGLITLVFGLILIANYDEAGWGLSLIWVAALFGFIGGFAMIFRAFQDRKA
jgi:uncharacterized membrane protein HdeD (DUF308 family)